MRRTLIIAFLLILVASSITAEPVSAQAPRGMVHIEGERYQYVQVNRWREGLERNPYREGALGDAYVETEWVELDDYFIGRTEVTNRQYSDFIDATDYQPEWPRNFLKHWSGSDFPADLADHPVVYVDYHDAEAYCAWRGGSLPTEAQWQFAAQGSDGRLFPWGNDWDPSRANVNTDGTMPVGSFPDGASPSGILDLTGNVAEMTASFQDDGWHWFSYLRGGSWFQASGSLWYTENGLLTNQQRLKFWWLNPGYNRSPAVGFRCVLPAE